MGRDEGWQPFPLRGTGGSNATAHYRPRLASGTSEIDACAGQPVRVPSPTGFRPIATTAIPAALMRFDRRCGDRAKGLCQRSSLTNSAERRLVSQPESNRSCRRSGNCKHRERAGRVKGAQRRSGPLTRPSAPGKSGTGATANQDAITPGNLRRNTCGRTAAEAKQFLLFLPGGNSALRFVRILGQHSHAHNTRAPAHLRH